MWWLRRFRQRREYQRINNSIEKTIKNEKKDNLKQYKVLLIGASETGKSTLMKQIKLLHGGGFSDKDRECARETVVSNMCVCVYSILCHRLSDSDSQQFPILLEYAKGRIT